MVQDLEAGKGRTTWGKLQAVLEILNLRLEPEGPLVASWRKTLNSDDRMSEEPPSPLRRAEVRQLGELAGHLTERAGGGLDI